MKACELLEAAAELLKPRGAWCRGNWAHTELGVGCDPLDPEAASFCLIGAIRKALGEPYRHHLVYDNAIVCVSAALNLRDPDDIGLIPDWNDRSRRRKGEVIAALKAGADVCRSQGQ